MGLSAWKKAKTYTSEIYFRIYKKNKNFWNECLDFGFWTVFQNWLKQEDYFTWMEVRFTGLTICFPTCTFAAFSNSKTYWKEVVFGPDQKKYI